MAMHLNIDLASGADGRPTPPKALEAFRGNRCLGTTGYPSQLVEAVTLRDGTRLTVRPICADDFQLEFDFVRALSARSGYQRLLSPRKLSTSDIERFVRIDYGSELALIALAVVDDAVHQVGVARYAPEPDGSSCDFAIVIADEWQGRGLGKALLSSLVRAAKEAGVQELTGLTLSENYAMRDLARQVGFSVRRDPDDPTVVQLRMPLHTAQSGSDRAVLSTALM